MSGEFSAPGLYAQVNAGQGFFEGINILLIWVFYIGLIPLSESVYLARCAGVMGFDVAFVLGFHHQNQV